MKGGMSVSGVGHVESMLRNIARRVPDVARGQMKRSAARVVKLAQIMVPEDEGHLKDSIRIEKSYGYRGRLEISIIAGKQMVTRHNGKTVSLDQYALLVHEAYETAVAPNGPGEGTKAKMAAHPTIKIGSGFLFRALESEKESFNRVMAEVIDKVITEEGG
ncbi:hypothetical protein PXK56_18030 [Phaeobacter gallaeciensis]|uniref:HK97 gp10 family phage protein n=1 Tax=Phaeobacter gallaeciensis TaxID=60890 RepID=UPI00237FF8F4|nr:HK97 gp10 family phage protein [Phaeobacter gallaeciensis]MDE4297089.1 hypothetical protein [Phaeobacter gallaeciensis]